MNDYQKKLLDGLEKFSLAIDALTREQLETRINNSQVKDKFQHYETLEKLLFKSACVNVWSSDQPSLVIEAGDSPITWQEWVEEDQSSLVIEAGDSIQALAA